MVKNCRNCSEEKEGVLHCSACKLPDAFYCSKECQKSDWKKHKIDCKLARLLDVNQTELDICYDHDSTDIKDYDAALLFAKKYMPNVKQLTIGLRQAGMFKQSEMLSDLGTMEPLITFAYETFRDYLACVPLEAFTLACEDCIERQVYDFTKDGKVFETLQSSTTLRKFRVVSAAVKKIEYLPFNTNLKVLELSYVKLSKWNGPLGWSPEDAEEMVSRISALTQLETLTLDSVPLGDQHMERLLGTLSQLRCLQIEGHWGETNLSSRDIGQITDRGCEIISRTRPELQSLGLSCQPKITSRGALQIVRSCRDLRELKLNYCSIEQHSVSQIVECSETLLLLGLDTTDRNVLGAAAKLSGGRTLFYSGTRGLIEPKESLTQAEREIMKHSRELLVAAGKLLSSPSCYNEYAPLLGVDVTARG